MQWLHDYLPLIQWLAYLVLAAMVFITRAGYAGGGIARDLKLLAERIEKAGREMSTLATKVQGLPEELRRVFLPREMADEYRREAREDHARFRAEIDEIQRRVWRDPTKRTRGMD